MENGNKASQSEKILNFIRKTGGITRFQAARMGIRNLRARVNEIRKTEEIESEIVKRVKIYQRKDGKFVAQNYNVSKYKIKK